MNGDGTITDNATYKAGEQGRPSTGIPYVVVNGTRVVKEFDMLRHPDTRP